MRAQSGRFALLSAILALALTVPLQGCGCAAVAIPPTIFFLRGGPPLELTAQGMPPSAAQALVGKLALAMSGELARRQTSCWSSSDNMRLNTRGLSGFGYPRPEFIEVQPGGSSGQLVIAGDDSRFELMPLPDTDGARAMRLIGRFSQWRAQQGLFEIAPEEATAHQQLPAGGYTLLRVDWRLEGVTAAGQFSIAYSQAMQWRSTRQLPDHLLADLSALPPFK